MQEYKDDYDEQQIHTLSRTFAAQPAGEGEVFGLDGDALGVDSAKVCVVEEVHEEGFCGFLEGYNGLTLPPIGAVLGCDCLCDLADLERC